MPRAMRLWGLEPIADRTRARTIALYQLVTGMMALLSMMVGLAMGTFGELGLLLGGMIVIIAMTAASIAVPWSRIAFLWSALLPIGDIAAIGMMRQSDPAGGFTLVWIFPAVWLAVSYGLVGLVVGNVLVNGGYWLTVSLDTHESATPLVVLFPLTIAAITLTCHIVARRTAYQRILLATQANLLARSVARARRQEDTLTAVLDAVDFGVILIGLDGQESVRNEAHARMQRLLGDDERRSVVFAEDGVSELSPDGTPLARLRRGELFEREVVWYGRPGTGRRALSVVARGLVEADGASAGAILVSRDVTDELNALRAREDLVASVSHELRTPLTSIVGYLELVLEADELSPRARRGLEIAERNATRLLAIVADLLTDSVAGRGGTPLSINPESVRLDELLRAAVEALTARIDVREMRLDTTAVEPLTARVDPLRIRQVVDNLLGNAVKYGRHGGRIDVGLTEDRDHALIVVRDDGPGIASEELPRLFDRFFRSDTVRRTSTHGSGLGLSISRDIVRAHRGEITVQSEPDAGATFIVRLPLRAPEVSP